MRKREVLFVDEEGEQVARYIVEAEMDNDAIEKANALFHRQFPDKDIKLHQVHVHDAN